nr:MAG TPA: hypothetical protein [Caudoviricetes sp.]
MQMHSKCNAKLCNININIYSIILHFITYHTLLL